MRVESKAGERAHRHPQQPGGAGRDSTTVRLRDPDWSLDATHLRRDAEGEDIKAEVLREVASTRNIEVSLGVPACAVDVVALLDAAVCACATPRRSYSPPTTAAPTRASASRRGAGCTASCIS